MKTVQVEYEQLRAPLQEHYTSFYCESPFEVMYMYMCIFGLLMKFRSECIFWVQIHVTVKEIRSARLGCFGSSVGGASA